LLEVHDRLTCSARIRFAPFPGRVLAADDWVGITGTCDDGPGAEAMLAVS